MESSRRFPARKPTRLPHFDYANCGMYFITMCVRHMESRFGAVEEGLVALNDAGIMVLSTWEANITRYPGATLDAFVVMPNHMHAIVFLGTDPEGDESGATLSRIVQSFKSISTVEYTRWVRMGAFPAFDNVLWQRGFHDKIIRSDSMQDAERTYIEGNPGTWQERSDA